MGVYEKALELAVKAHDGQRRKYSMEPYITHPIRVAGIVRPYAASSPAHMELMAAATVMHDVVEDTTVTEEDLRREFPKIVVGLVMEVTNKSKPSDGNRSVRKEIDRQHLAKASFWGQVIKLADLIDNTDSIVQYDPDFAKVYLPEKIALLDVLTNAPPVLQKEARKQVEAGMKKFGL
jgi:(p)ppGpp synthase/HD superfamily hydrolase